MKCLPTPAAGVEAVINGTFGPSVPGDSLVGG